MQIWPWCRNAPKVGRVDGVVEVRVREHDQRVVAAELEHDALELPAAASASLRPVAVEPVKLIRRTAGFSTSSSPIGAASPGAWVTMFRTPAGSPASAKISPQSSPPDDRRPLRRLQHDRVAERERRGDRARREDQRRVPRRDRADHADRLAQAHRERARMIRRDHLADGAYASAAAWRKQAGHEAHLEHAEAEASQPVSRASELDDLVAAALEDVGGLQEDPLPLGRRRLRPRRERRGRGVDRAGCLRPRPGGRARRRLR